MSDQGAASSSQMASTFSSYRNDYDEGLGTSNPLMIYQLPTGGVPQTANMMEQLRANLSLHSPPSALGIPGVPQLSQLAPGLPQVLLGDMHLPSHVPLSLSSFSQFTSMHRPPRPPPGSIRYRKPEDPLTAEEQEKVLENYDGDEAVEEQQGDLYAHYRPAKVDEGVPHPDPIVETSSLSGVQPPDVKYKHHIADCVDDRQISDAQLETVVYSMMRFNIERLTGAPRPGFFLGDGAGVGKGRQIAAVIKDFWRCGGRRILWVSTSQDLRYDARRDLDDVSCNIPVYPEEKNPVPKGKLSQYYQSGVLFVTYSLLVHGARPKEKETKGKVVKKSASRSSISGGQGESGFGEAILSAVN